MTDFQDLFSGSGHPNTPLVEVVFEMRFPDETSVECRRNEIQSRIRSEYPHLHVSPSINMTHPGLEPCRFVRDDNLAGVMISVNRLSYFSRAYPGFESFKLECLRVVAIFQEVIHLERLTRVGLRHINIAPFSRENNFLPLKHYFSFAEPLEKLYGTQFEQFMHHVVFPSASGSITLHVEVIRTETGNQEAFLIDIDHAGVDNWRPDDVEYYLERAHSESAAQFIGIITSGYYDYIRGEEI